MRIDIFDQIVELATNRSIVMHQARNAEVVCTNGRIWITEDPFRNDIVLEKGQSHVVQVDDLAFVTAMIPSSVWVREPVKAAAWRPRPGGMARLQEAVRSVVGRWRGSAGGDGAPA